MVASVFAAHGATVGTFQRIRIQDIIILSHRDSGAALPVILNFELAVIVGEGVAGFVHNQRQNSFLENMLIGLIIITAIHEYVLVPRMAMEVVKQVDNAIL